jgi:choline dehydrogenase-like flavoprotein
MNESARGNDFIVVGGGTAGCVLARRLSDAGARVLLLESGPPYHRRHSVPLPSLNYTQSRCRTLETTPQAGLDGRTIDLMVANIVGGGSSVNAMLYSRGNRADYDVWERLGGPRWSYANALRLYKKAERFHGEPSEYHGQDGPMSVSPPRYVSPFSTAFLAACEELGLPRNQDMNGEAQAGFGPYPVTQHRGVRSSAASAYLARARNTSHLEVQTHVTVTRLGLSGTTAAWVEGTRDGKACRWEVAGEVILCAGALRTPQLLLLSGVGPENELRSHGLPCVVKRAGVGQALSDHVRVPMLFGATRRPPLSPNDFGSPLGLLRTAGWGLAYAFARRGVIATNLCEVGGFVAVHDSKLPNVQFVPHFIGLDPVRADVVDLEPCLVRPRSKGSLRLTCADPSVAPRVDPAYLSEDDDVAVLVDAVKLARELAGTRALKTAGVVEQLLPGRSARSNAEIAAFVRSVASTCFHPTGTCAMGPASSDDAVVGPDLRLHGLTNVRVVDASVFPALVAGNTCAPVVMVAENAAEMILEPSTATTASAT